MDLRHLSPAGIRPPFGRYHHLVEASGATRLLFLSGQLGIRPDGTVPEEVTAQTAQAFANIDACLAAAGFTRAQVLRLSVFLTEA
ncbi:MAG: RidA family protein, partial [Geminicoccaceae bacterium]